MAEHTASTLKSLAVTTIRSIRQPVATLSGGQRQSVAVAKAVQWNSKLVILDEPTAALGVAQTEQVLALVRRLGEQGLGVVIISHNLHDVFETANRITVLRLGRNVGVFEREKTTQQEVVAAITAGVPTKVAGIPSTAGAIRVTHRRSGRPSLRRRQEAAEEAPGLLKRITTNIRSGNLGIFPIVVGEIVIVVFFGFKATNFFTAVNFGNIIIQMAGTTMLAYGVVFVLLLGEIDLSIGYVAGIGALVVAELQLPGSGHQLNGLIAIVIAVLVCARHRRRAGLDRGLRRRPIVRRHACGLPDLAGRDPREARGPGLDHHPGPLDQLHRELLLLAGGRLADRGHRHGPLRADRAVAAAQRAWQAGRLEELVEGRCSSWPASRSRRSAPSRSATTASSRAGTSACRWPA